MKSIIIDDVFPAEQYEQIKAEQFKIIDEHLEYLSLERWCYFDTYHPSQKLALTLFNIAKQHVDLKDCTGYETWQHHNTRPPRWHIDNDENRRAEDNKMVYPLCSIIYYIHVKDLQGGQLYISHNEDMIDDSNDTYNQIRTNGALDRSPVDIVTPKSNRMFIMPPKKFHIVSEFTGERTMIALNPWDASKFKYPNKSVHT